MVSRSDDDMDRTKDGRSSEKVPRSSSDSGAILSLACKLRSNENVLLRLYTQHAAVVLAAVNRLFQDRNNQTYRFPARRAGSVWNTVWRSKPSAEIIQQSSNCVEMEEHAGSPTRKVE